MKRLRRFDFRCAREGSVAVEFALVATSFVLLLLAILQFSLFFLSRVIMQDVLADLATGDGASLLQAQNRSGTQTYICKKLVLSPKCTSDLKLEMVELGSASATTMSTTFAKGAVGSIMVVRAESPVAVFLPLVPAISVRGKAIFLQS